MRRPIRLWPCWLLLLATSCEMPPESRAEPDAGGGAGAAATLLWTGSIQGELLSFRAPPRPRGGLARIATLATIEREYTPGLLLVDLGDFTGDPIEGSDAIDGSVARRERGRLALEAFGLMGYDAVVPGERDLSLGATRLRRWADEAGVPLLATNLAFADTNEPLGPRELWVQTDHGSVAVLGIVAPLSEEEALAAAEGHGREVEVLDPRTVLSATLDEVRPEAARVVLLAHGPVMWALQLVAAVPGVDICIVAHDGDAPVTAPMIMAGTSVLTTGRRGDFVGRIRLELTGGSAYTLRGALYEVTEEISEDPEVEALVGTLPVRLNEAQAALAGASDRRDHPTGGVYVGWTGCNSCHPVQGARWLETPHVAAFQGLQRIGWHAEPECFECHTTGFGWLGGFETRALTPFLGGVSCEACHGPGDTESHDAPGYGAIDRSVCRSCHTDEVDPGFDYGEAYGAVRHDARDFVDLRRGSGVDEGP